MTSAASPWVAGDGGGSSPPAIVGEVLAVALAAGLCVLLGVLWVSTPRRPRRGRRRARSPPRRIRSGLRGGSLVLIGGILVVAALLLAFWFLLGQVDHYWAPPPTATTARRRRPAASGRRRVRPHRPSSTGSSSAWSASIAVILPLVLDCPAQASGARRRACLKRMTCPNRSCGRSASRSTRSSAIPTLVARSSVPTRRWSMRSTTRDAPSTIRGTVRVSRPRAAGRAGEPSGGGAPRDAVRAGALQPARCRAANEGGRYRRVARDRTQLEPPSS